MLTYRLKSTNVFPGTTTTNTGNDPAAPDASTTGDHRRIFANQGAPTGRRSADLAHDHGLWAIPSRWPFSSSSARASLRT